MPREVADQTGVARRARNAVPAAVAEDYCAVRCRSIRPHRSAGSRANVGALYGDVRLAGGGFDESVVDSAGICSVRWTRSGRTRLGGPVERQCPPRRSGSSAL